MTPEQSFREQVSNDIKRNDVRLDMVMEKISAIEREQCLINEKLKASTKAIDNVQANTKEMLVVFESWKGAMKVLEWIGKIAKPLIYIVGLSTAVFTAYTTFKTGGLGK